MNLKTARHSAPAGTVRLFPQQDSGLKSTCFPVACLLVGLQMVSVTVMFQGIWATGSSKCPFVYLSHSPAAKQMAFLLWKKTVPLRHHPISPSTGRVRNGSCLLLLITYREGIAHPTQNMIMVLGVSLKSLLWIANLCLYCRNIQLKTQWVLSTSVRSRSPLLKGTTQTQSVEVHLHLAVELGLKSACTINMASVQATIRNPFYTPSSMVCVILCVLCSFK